MNSTSFDGMVPAKVIDVRGLLQHLSILSIVCLSLTSCKIGQSVQDGLSQGNAAPAGNSGASDQGDFLITSPASDDALLINTLFNFEVEDSSKWIQMDAVQFEYTDSQGIQLIAIDREAPFETPVHISEVGNKIFRAIATYADGSVVEKEITLYVGDPNGNTSNTAPVAIDDASFSTQENTPLPISVNSLLSNDTDDDGDLLIVTGVLSPVNGSVEKVGNTITFTPSNNYTGNGYFNYRISDGLLSDEATVTVQITQNNTNTAPYADNDAYTIDQGNAGYTNNVFVGDYDNDGDDIDLVPSSITSPSHGTLSNINNETGSFTYTPDANYYGTDSFKYRITDGDLQSNLATVTFTINQVTPSATVPTGISATGDDLIGSDGNEDAIHISWSANSANQSVYAYQVRYNSDNNTIASTGLNTAHTFQNLTPGQNYKTQVRAVNAGGASQWSGINNNQVTLNQSTIPLTTPTGYTAVAGDANGDGNQDKITVNWNANAANQGVTNYQVSINGSVSGAGTATSKVLSNLTPGQTYVVKMRAQRYPSANGGSGSDFSNWTNEESRTLSMNNNGGVNGNGGGSAPNDIDNMYASVASTQLSAYATASKITLYWAKVTNRTQNSVQISRKSPSATNFTWVASPSNSSYSWDDNTVTSGQQYEYRVVINGNAYGYITAGHKVEIDQFKGKIVLLVDSSVRSSILNEIKQLKRDLYGDGWKPVEVTTNTAGSDPFSIRNYLVTNHSDAKSVYILGHVPILYAGSNNPDSHAGRAMSADGFYGELTSTWPNGSSGCSLNTQQATLLENPNHSSNVSCQSSFPSTLEAQVGRVDMKGLSTMGGTEVTRLSNYLNKASGYKHKQWTAQKRAWIKNGLHQNGWSNARDVWGTHGSVVGPNNIDYNNTEDTQQSYIYLDNNSYLFSYGSFYGAQQAQGTNEHCPNGVCNGKPVVGTTTKISSRNWGAVFNTSWGSYWGEMNANNGYLRALIDSGDALSHGYNGYSWFFHPMGMGETIGYVAKQTMNNEINQNYNLVRGSYVQSGNTHINLIGDPSMRAEYTAPPSNLTQSGSTISLDWDASSDSNIDGYHVYQITGYGLNRLTSSPISQTTFNTGVSSTSSNNNFIVRAIKLVETNSGTYYLPSVGIVSPNLVP